MAIWTAYKTFVFSNNPAWGIDGIGGTLDSANSNSGTRIYNNSDGTFTVLTGTGIAGSADGPTWTTLSSVRHLAADKSLIEEITGITATSAPAGHFFSGGILSGDDTFVGSSGADRFYGQGGNNTVLGGGGADEFHTAGGNDTFRVQAGDFVAGETIDAGGGTDTIQLENTGSVDLSSGTISSVEILKYFSGTSVVTASALQFAGSANGGAAAITTVVGSSNVDRLTFKDVGNLNFSGLTFTSWTPGQDTITYLVQGPGNFGSIVATSQNETFQLVGDGGNISSGGGDDTFVFNGSSFHGGISLDGGTGTNVIQLNSATVDYTSDQGTSLTNIQQIQYTSGNSTFTVSDRTLAGAMPHTIIGSAGIDKFVVNTVTGQADLSGIAFNSWTEGTDSIVIDGRSGGSSSITGSNHADTIYAFTGQNYAGNHIINGGGGNDTAIFSGNLSAYTSHFEVNNGYQVVRAIAGTDTMFSIENIAFDDTTVNTTGDDFVGGVSTLGSIGLGASSFGNYSFAGDRDWFRFNVDGSTHTTILLEGASSGQGTLSDPYLRVYDASGNLVASDDNSSFWSNDSLLAFTPGTTGTYYIGASRSGDSNSSFGTYTANIGVGNPSMRHDMNVDGHGDIIWRNTSSGAIYDWQMSGAVVTPINVGGLSSAWHSEGIGDFSGDHRSDILWRNDDGTIYEWQMNGGVVTPTYVGGLGLSWRAEAIGDFNGDYRSDILWRNTDGTIYTWQMNGASVTPSNIGSLGQNWHVEGTGDFNGDLRSDILWRDTSGTIYEWQMNGGLATPVNVGTLGQNWRAEGFGDFNADGRTDILWRDTSSGAIYEWQMNGAIATPVQVGSLNQSWHVENIADYNGDGRSDILWRNDDGTIAEWQMHGAAVTAAVTVGGLNPTDWHIV